MNSLKIGALCALLITGAVVPMSAYAQKTESAAPMHQTSAPMHKACEKCAKMGMKECNHPLPLKGSVYICKECKVYFTPEAAKKMKNKDPMGHKLVKINASKLPEGFKDGSKMEMKEGGKM